MDFSWPPKWLQRSEVKTEEAQDRTREPTLIERVVQALEETRDLFAATHWTTGTLYTVDSTGKKRFCAVGGFCNTLRSMQGTPEALNLQPDMSPAAASRGYTELFDSDVLDAVFEAERELAVTVGGHQLADREASRVRNGAKLRDIALPEDIIIGWNDNSGLDSDLVVGAFNETIDRVKEDGLTVYPLPFAAAA